SRVAPTKGDLAVGQRDQSMIGNGPAMGIATEILEHIFGAAEGRFGVNDPVLSEPWSQPGSEDLGLREQSQVPGKMKLAMLKSRHGRRARGEVRGAGLGSSVGGRPSDTSGNGDCDSCYTRWWHDVRHGCTHRCGRQVQRCDSAR